MSWDASDEETWDRWEWQRTQYCTTCGGVLECARPRLDHTDWCICERTVAGAKGSGGGGVAGETAAARPERMQDRRRDPESLHPAYGLYDRYPHEED